MYSQDQQKKDTKVSDLILVGVIIAAFFGIRSLMEAFPETFEATTTRLVLAVPILVFCVLIYSLRISQFRYSLCHTQPEPYYNEAYCTFEEVRLPFPLYTFNVQKGVAEKGKIVETVHGSEMLALMLPEADTEAYLDGYAKNKEYNFTKGPKKKAHCLIYTRKDTLYRMYITPDETMFEHLSRLIAEKPWETQAVSEEPEAK